MSIKKNYDEEKNILIEGDSLNILKKLKQQYEKKIKMIYIDPPYNTERTNMTYNDKRDEEEFLYLISNTLKDSYHLLKDNGIIFVSISSHKMHIIRTELEKIYKKENYAATMIRIENAKQQKIGKASLKENYEFIIAFYKNKNKKELNYIKNNIYLEFQKSMIDLYKITKKEKSKDKYYIEEIINLKKENYTNKELKLLKKIWTLQEQSKGLKQYKYYDEETQKPFRAADINMYLGKGEKYELIHPITNKICKNPKYNYPNYEKFSKDNIFEIIGYNEKEIPIIKLKEQYKKTKLKYISKEKILCGNLIFGINEQKIPDYKNELDILKHPDTILNITGSDDRYITKLFNGVKVFDYPKPLKLLDYLIDISTKENDLVLDFFAGSGTTGESAYNKKRNFILIQKAEKLDLELKEKIIKNNKEKLLLEQGEEINTIYDLTKQRLKLTKAKFKEMEIKNE